jgi:two-component system chemotaxis response regulator CheV
LLFSLGTDQRTGRKEVFGINVFKVREVMRTPEITSAPEMPASVEGMVSLRGALVPVIDLAKYTGIVTASRPEIMIITEYNGHTQGFLVESVDTILRLDWSAMHVPPDMITNRMAGLVTAVTELENNTLVMMMDVEKVLAETSLVDDSHLFINVKPIKEERMVFFADDSVVARKQIERTLDAMNIKHVQASNGKMAWEELQRMAMQADLAGQKLCNILHLVLTDVEMPEMDGYMLTKMIKSDARFAGIPVLMHSSLSGISNQKLGESVGVDAYVSKFEPQKLSIKLREMLNITEK